MFKLVHSEKEGPYLVATRQIPKGTSIIKSQPLVIGPVSVSLTRKLLMFGTFGGD
jgi:hypothetical protein